MAQNLSPAVKQTQEVDGFTEELRTQGKNPISCPAPGHRIRRRQ